MSAWRIEIRTGFYHRAKKNRPVKGLILSTAVWRRWVLLAQCETLNEYMSAWRIKIRTGFYHRAKKTRPVKGLKLNPAVWRRWVALAQCETLGCCCVALTGRIYRGTCNPQGVALG